MTDRPTRGLHRERTRPGRRRARAAIRAAILGAALILAALFATVIFAGPAQASVSFQTFTTAGPTAGVNSITVSAPTGTAVNDVLLIQLSGTGANPTISTVPTGWTVVNKLNSGTNVWEAVYWKRATASEPSSYTWGFNTTSTYAATVLRYSGAIQTVTPVEKSSSKANTAAPITWTTLTPAYANEMLVALATTQSSGASFTDPTVLSTALTSRVKQTATAPSFASWDRVLPATTATGAFTSGSTAYSITHAILLRPQPAPTVTSISPTSGPATGATSVAITGTNFTTAGSTVMFGPNPAASVTVNSATSITATSPAGTGVVDVLVTTAGGTSANTSADNFSYIPVVTGISPTSGPLASGTSVIITGTGFASVTAVKFGSTAAIGYTVNSGTQITATSPAGSAGTVDVTVAVAAGTSATGAADKFTYVTAPTVTGVSPTSGPATGTTSVAITGTNFTGASAVKFGSNAAASYTVNSATSITATSPAGTGVVDVTVTTAGGTSATGAGDRFSYVPVVTGISPISGPLAGGTSVVITGAGLTGATAVKFGASAATGYTVNPDTQITATSPAGSAGTVDVTVTGATGTSVTGVADQFTYVVAPTVTGVSPGSGPTGGGTSVAITGTGFGSASAVTFGSTAAASFTVNSATSITATSPAGSAGTVDVTVTAAGGTSVTGSADRFTYVSAPSVGGVSPNLGPTSGGTSVTITGSNFSGASTVRFGSISAAGFTVNSSTQITATSPAQGAATVDVRVTTVGGTSGTGSADRFTYMDGPTIGTISPNTGSVAGGQSVTISGTNFDTLSDTTVTFGGTAGTVTAGTGTSITVTTPARDNGGAVDVVVTAPGGSATSTDGYTYVGSLSITTPTVGSFGVITLNGMVQTATATMGTFTVVDSRGSGVGWNVTVQESQFITAGHTLPLGSVSMPQPNVAKGTPQSTNVPTILPGPYVIDSASTVKIASAPADGSGEGSYIFTPGLLTLTVPANTYGGTYTSTVTVSVISGP